MNSSICQIRCQAPWLQNVLIIISWPHCIKGGKEFRVVGIRDGRERVADVIRIITWLKGDSTVQGTPGLQFLLMCLINFSAVVVVCNFRWNELINFPLPKVTSNKRAGWIIFSHVGNYIYQNLYLPSTSTHTTYWKGEYDLRDAEWSGIGDGRVVGF